MMRPLLIWDSGGGVFWGERGDVLLSSLLHFLMNHDPERQSRKEIKAQFGLMPPISTSFCDAVVSLNFIRGCREVRKWEAKWGAAWRSSRTDLCRPQIHPVEVESAAFVPSSARSAAFNANLVEAQTFVSHNMMVLSARANWEASTGRARL